MSVPLPDWAQGSVQGQLLVPQEALVERDGASSPAWDMVDWWSVVFWFLTCQAERRFEERNGPIHSYSYLLVREGFDERLWERAWVNRIGQFLASWQSHVKIAGSLEPRPTKPGRIWLVHDVDALRKTPAIRLKQSVFHFFNALRLARGGQWRAALTKGSHGLRFLLSNPSYWAFEQICGLEEQRQMRSQFLFYAGKGGLWRWPVQQLFDPDYDTSQPPAAQQMARLSQGGWQVGLHQSFRSWSKAEDMQQELAHLQRSTVSVDLCCRQHWLRFSWSDTWAAQEQAGLKFDTTLGFNDRSGFRNGAALRFRPWGLKGSLECVPMVVTDSQLYDYCLNKPPSAKAWLEEVAAVGGEAAVVWHQQVFNEDYGWGPGYQQLLDDILATPNLTSAL